jgi:acetyl esterase/lipase
MTPREDRSILNRPGRPPDRTLPYGDDPDQIVDLFSPAIPHQGGSRTVLVMLHGGFWRPAFDRLHTRAFTEALHGTGHTVAAVEYRRIPGDPSSTVADIGAGLAFLGSSLRSRLIVLGHSAGGHLALWAAAAAPVQIAGVVALAPVADLRLAQSLRLGADAVAAFLDAADRPDLDPTRLPTPAAPITIVHGADDDIVPLAVAQSYLAAHPAARLVTIPGTGHFALIDPGQPAVATVLAEVRRLL